jgi:uncharacterized membrane protein YhaH (DUF805 family)
MSDDLRKQIYGNLRQRGTDDLIEIWRSNNRAEWTEMAFEVIREILHERLIELPPQDQPINDADETNIEVADMTLAQIYFSFNGRIGLKTYWLMGVLPILGFMVLFGFIEGATPTYSAYSGVPTLLGRLFVLWLSLTFSVKRWHDRDKSGWWVLIGLIPLVGLIWAFIETGFLSGTEGPNRYGSKSF